MRWLQHYDAELAISSVVVGEIAFGIAKIRPDQRATRLQLGLDHWLQRLAGRIFAFTDEAALVYGELMGEASRRGQPVSAPDGMIAAVALIHSGALATRNTADFSGLGVTLVNPWEQSSR